MSESTLSPEFVSHVQRALQKVSTRDCGPITADRTLVDLGLDSVDIAELLIELEEEFDVTLDEQTLGGIKTFGDLSKHLERLPRGADADKVEPLT